MSISDAVIQGEAIESENESDVEFDAQNKELKVKLKRIHCFSVYLIEFFFWLFNWIQTQYGQEASEGGTVFSGEAPESDDEILAFSSVKLGSAQEVTEVYRPSPRRKSQRYPSEDVSVLQKLLGNQMIHEFAPWFMKMSSLLLTLATTFQGDCIKSSFAWTWQFFFKYFSRSKLFILESLESDRPEYRGNRLKSNFSCWRALGSITVETTGSK